MITVENIMIEDTGDLSAELRLFRGLRKNRNLEELDRLQSEADTLISTYYPEINGREARQQATGELDRPAYGS